MGVCRGLVLSAVGIVKRTRTLVPSLCLNFVFFDYISSSLPLGASSQVVPPGQISRLPDAGAKCPLYLANVQYFLTVETGYTPKRTYLGARTDPSGTTIGAARGVCHCYQRAPKAVTPSGLLRAAAGVRVATSSQRLANVRHAAGELGAQGERRAAVF